MTYFSQSLNAETKQMNRHQFFKLYVKAKKAAQEKAAAEAKKAQDTCREHPGSIAVLGQSYII